MLVHMLSQTFLVFRSSLPLPVYFGLVVALPAYWRRLRRLNHKLSVGASVFNAEIQLSGQKARSTVP